MREQGVLDAQSAVRGAIHLQVDHALSTRLDRMPTAAAACPSSACPSSAARRTQQAEEIAARRAVWGRAGEGHRPRGTPRPRGRPVRRTAAVRRSEDNTLRQHPSAPTPGFQHPNVSVLMLVPRTVVVSNKFTNTTITFILINSTIRPWTSSTLPAVSV